MIKDLDETIRTLILERAAFSESDVEISFKQPTGGWAAGLTKPTITCYLYDVQENEDLRDTAVEYRPESRWQVARGFTPIRVDLTYFVTAWTTEVEDEHEILWRLYGALANANPLPEELLHGRLREQPHSIATRTGHRLEDLSNLTDLWNVMDNQFRPSLNYTVTLALERTLEIPTTMVLSKRLRFFNSSGDRPEGDSVQIGGVVYENKTRRPIQGAQVVLLGRGTQVTTDEFGRYSLAGLSDGKHQLRVIVDGTTSEHEITVDASTDGEAFDLAFNS